MVFYECIKLFTHIFNLYKEKIMKKALAILLLGVCLLVAGCGEAPVDPNSVVAPDDITTAPATETTSIVETYPEDEYLIEQEEEFYEDEIYEDEFIEDDYYEDDYEDDYEDEEEDPEE